jgi:putative ABC transport system ATP-binding protein
MSLKLITARDLVKTYKMGEEVIRALDGVSFAIDQGGYVAIIGASGSGKSTLMNVLGGLDTPSAGELVIADQPIGALKDSGLARFRNETIGFVFQSFNLLPRLSALENVELPMIYAGLPAARRRERAKALLTRVGLGQRLSHKPTQLSGGQQQRVAIARALANEPALLLADEPTGALDTATTAEILDLFDTLNSEGVSIVIVTHEHDVAARAKRVIEMRDGRILSDRSAR